MSREYLHIIHLRDRTDRWELLQHELQEQRVNSFRIWDGIRDPEGPQRGISKAHKQIVAWAKYQGLPQVVIAEDDIWFSAPGALDYFLDHQPADFSGNTLYVARESFYDTILNLPEDKDIDRAMAGLGKFVVCSPMVACQQAGYSDHHDRQVNFDAVIRQNNWFTG